MAKKKVKKKTEMQDLSEFIRDHMVTKEYLDDKLAPIYKTLNVHTELHESHTKNLLEIREEVRDIRRDLEKLEIKVQNLKGYGDDIKFLYERVGAIEKHLGMTSSSKH